MTQDRKEVATTEWYFLGQCCNPCMGRKTNASKPTSDGIKGIGMTKIVLLGSAGSGKSRLLSVLSGEKESEAGYAPTNGTRNVKFSSGSREVSLVEVGGNLSKFWSRAIDSKVDGVWYILTREEYESRELTVFVDFLGQVRESLNARGLLVLATVVGESDISAEAALERISPTILDIGLFLPVKVSVCAQFDKNSVIESLKPLIEVDE